MTRKAVLFLTIAILLSNFGRAQTAEQVLSKYHDTIQGLKSFSYKINNIDTFLTGASWNTTGYCLLKRDENEPTFGFLFKGKRDDVDEELLFCGKEYYEVNSRTKTYTIEKDIHRGILGHPGGQMVLGELVERIEGYESLSLAETDSSYILKFGFPDNAEDQVENRYKEVHIDNKTYLPFYRYHSLENLGNKQINRAYLSDVKVNVLDSIDPFVNKNFREEYTYVVPPTVEDELGKLLNKKAPDFELTNIDRQNHRLSAQKGKVILLNFWEPWCGPCVRSIGKLKEWSEQYPKEKFEIWSIVSDETAFGKIRDVAKRRAINYQVFFGSEKTSKDYFVYSVPLYVLIDQEGKIKYATAGFSPELEEQLKTSLK